MPVEDHLRYPEWLEAQNALLAAKVALKEGRATQADVDTAQAEYHRISGELDA